jgi:hypothetical protein
VTIPIRLILYIIYIALSSLRLNPLPKPLKAVARGFLVLFHIGIQSPSTIYYNLLLFFLSPPTSTPPLAHTPCLFYRSGFRY